MLSPSAHRDADSEPISLGSIIAAGRESLWAKNCQIHFPSIYVENSQFTCQIIKWASSPAPPRLLH